MATKTPSRAKTVKRRKRGATNTETMWPNNVSVVRKKRRMTQTELAEIVGTGQTTVAAIETGRISGRTHMYKIAGALGVQVTDLFPHANFLTIREAATAVGASTTLIYRRIQEGQLRTKKIRNTNFIIADDVLRPDLRKRIGPSIKDQLHYFLQKDGPLSVGELLDRFGGMSRDELLKTKSTIQVLLSRYPEFVKDDSTYPARWVYDPSLVAAPKKPGRKAKKKNTLKPSAAKANVARSKRKSKTAA